MALRNKTDSAFLANLEAIKSTVQCPDVAQEETVLRASGKDLRGPCPLPDHEGDSPSFYCYENQGFYNSWYCHRCSIGGDVLDLFGRMYNLDHHLPYVVQTMAEKYGINLWRWSDFEGTRERRFRIAKERADARIERYFTERLFEESVMPLINAIEDKSARLEELQKALSACGLDRPVKGWA